MPLDLPPDLVPRLRAAYPELRAALLTGSHVRGTASPTGRAAVATRSGGTACSSTGDPAAARCAHAAARTVLEAGPRVCEPAELPRMRYGVTDVLLDLIGSRDRISDGFVEVIDELLDRCGGRYLVGRSERG